MKQPILTKDERIAVRSAIRGSLDLYRGYVKLNPETPIMARKQALKRKMIPILVSALAKLREVQ
jgi:hypothetical protein